jgi:hypothetical protein
MFGVGGAAEWAGSASDFKEGEVIFNSGVDCSVADGGTKEARSSSKALILNAVSAMSC